MCCHNKQDRQLEIWAAWLGIVFGMGEPKTKSNVVLYGVGQYAYGYGIASFVPTLLL